MESFYAGVDVGSTAVRVGLLDVDNVLRYVESFPIEYHSDNKFFTQSTNQIVDGLHHCIDKLKTKGRILSIACSATCSIAVFKKDKIGSLIPYSVQKDLKDNDQNVVFWMDSRAVKETLELNYTLKDDDVLKFYGGSLIEEMAIPKVKYLVDNLPAEDLKDLVFLDLHDYLTKVVSDGQLFPYKSSNFETKRSIDCELRGWSSSFLTKIGLDQLCLNSFQALGSNSNAEIHDLPLAGTKLCSSSNGIVSQGVIDSYAGWIGSSTRSFEDCLVMVAGTSTCFIIAHKMKNATIKGIWGPFEGLLPDLYVSEGGQSTTGKLIEHLFETHPAFKGFDSNNIFDDIENHLAILESENAENIHIIAKNIHTYGDLSGNRTPFGDGSMRGVFFGESVDTSKNDFVLKYISILEFLSFQAKQIVLLFKENSININKIIICGSQAKNNRLVQLISNLTNLPVEISCISPDLAGVRGSALLAKAGYLNKPLADVISKKSSNIIVTPKAKNDLINLILNEKYKIMLDIAERQRYYNSIIHNLK